MSNDAKPVTNRWPEQATHKQGIIQFSTSTKPGPSSSWVPVPQPAAVQGTTCLFPLLADAVVQEQLMVAKLFISFMPVAAAVT